MTKEEKVLWATWMASTDIMEYAVDIVLDFDQMMDCELARIWDEGLHITLPWGECVAYPVKCWSVPKVMALTPHEGTLIECMWKNPDQLDELVVAELKRVGFVAPWVDEWEVKSILVAKWGKNWKRD